MLSSPSADELQGRLRRHVHYLAGQIGVRNVFRPEALRASEDYIRDVWSEQGQAVEEQTYTCKDIPSVNLEVTLPGEDPEAPILLIGAHYDTVSTSPGADDNASAVAALLELPRLLQGEALGCTLRFVAFVAFVAFVNEEPPFFFTARQGSAVYAKAARRRDERIRLMLSLEMLGYYRTERRTQRYPPVFRWFYPDRGDFIALVSNFRSRREMRRLATAFRAVSSFPLEHAATFAWIPGVAWSDHWSFWRRGYRAVMVTDTAFFRNPNYHGPRDTPDTLDYPRLEQVTLGLAGALALVQRPCCGVDTRRRGRLLFPRS